MGIQHHIEALQVEEDFPFPTANSVAAPPPIKYRTYALPAQQAAFDNWARDHHDGLLRNGMRRWLNTSNHVVTMAFNLGRPRWLDPSDGSADRQWPPEERQMVVTIAAGAEASIPEVWSRAIATVNPNSGEVIGGLCPWLRPLGCAPLRLAQGINAPEPFEPPKGAA